MKKIISMLCAALLVSSCGAAEVTDNTFTAPGEQLEWGMTLDEAEAVVGGNVVEEAGYSRLDVEGENMSSYVFDSELGLVSVMTERSSFDEAYGELTAEYGEPERSANGVSYWSGVSVTEAADEAAIDKAYEKSRERLSQQSSENDLSREMLEGQTLTELSLRDVNGAALITVDAYYLVLLNSI